jgi:chemotaxis protein CheZ
MARELVGEEMAAPRKVFRIEETAATRLERSIEHSPAALRHAEIMQELAALRALLSTVSPRRPGKPDAPAGAATARLASELNLIHGAISGTEHHRTGGTGSHAPAAHLTRIGHELDAVVNGTDTATQKILAAAEEIDQTANNLSAALKGKIEQEFAADIQDLVIQIFEACNFQDLAGQRVNKVMATLKFVEDHITRVLDEIKNIPPARPDPAQVLHGPRLDIDRGHVTQGDIDAMFGEP